MPRIYNATANNPRSMEILVKQAKKDSAEYHLDVYVTYDGKLCWIEPGLPYPHRRPILIFRKGKARFEAEDVNDFAEEKWYK